MKNPVAAIIMTAVAGCTTIEQKAEDYQDAAQCFGRPDKVVYCYSREGETRKGFEARCCGETCTVPECPTTQSE